MSGGDSLYSDTDTIYNRGGSYDYVYTTRMRHRHSRWSTYSNNKLNKTTTKTSKTTLPEGRKGRKKLCGYDGDTFFSSQGQERSVAADIGAVEEGCEHLPTNWMTSANPSDTHNYQPQPSAEPREPTTARMLQALRPDQPMLRPPTTITGIARAYSSTSRSS